MSNSEILIREAKTLPESIIGEVLDFIGYLKTKAAKTADQIGIDGECPLDHTPNATTLAAFAEGDAMMRGEIPSRWFKTPEEFFKALKG
jgi:hypothetical protein